LFFWCDTLIFEPFLKHKKGADNQQKRRRLLTTHINIIITLAHYCPPINHSMQWYPCWLPSNGKLATIRARWITFNMPWQLPIVVFFIAVYKKTAKHNILGAAQAKDNIDDKIIALSLPTLKNNNQQTMATERTGRTRQAMERWEREVRGQGTYGVEGGEAQQSQSHQWSRWSWGDTTIKKLQSTDDR
jgi:hypothetical protein